MRKIGQCAIAAAAFFSAWAAHISLGMGFTLVFLPVIIAFATSLIVFFAQPSFTLRRADLWLFGYLLILLLTALSSENPETGMQTWRLWLISFFGYVATRVLIQSHDSLRILAWACVAGAIVTLLNIAPAVDDWGNLGRTAVEGINSNYTAYSICGYIFVYLLYTSGFEASWRRRALDMIILALMIYILSTLATRGALIASVGMIVYWLLGTRAPTWLIRFGLLVVTTWSLLLSLGYMDFLLLALDSASGQRSTGDLAGREFIWQNAHQILSGNWLLGIGPGQFLSVSELGVGAHNFFLTVSLDTGIIGLVLMLGFIASFGWCISRARIGPRQLNPAILFFAYWVPIAMSGHWEALPFSWIVIGVTNQITLLSKSDPARSSAI